MKGIDRRIFKVEDVQNTMRRRVSTMQSVRRIPDELNTVVFVKPSTPEFPEIKEIQKICTLRPFFHCMLRPSSGDLNEEEALIFQDQLQHEINTTLVFLYKKIRKLFKNSNATGLFDVQANRVRFEAQLLVAVKREINLDEMANTMERNMAYQKAFIGSKWQEPGMHKMAVAADLVHSIQTNTLDASIHEIASLPIQRGSSVQSIPLKRSSGHGSFTRGPSGRLMTRKPSMKKGVARRASERKMLSSSEKLRGGSTTRKGVVFHVSSTTPKPSKLSAILQKKLKEGKIKQMYNDQISAEEEESEPVSQEIDFTGYPSIRTLLHLELMNEIRNPRHFHDRPLLDSAIDDVGKDLELTSREVPTRLRYLTDDTRTIEGPDRTILAPILDQYPVPPEALYAIQSHLVSIENQALKSESYRFIPLPQHDMGCYIALTELEISDPYSRAIDVLGIQSERKPKMTDKRIINDRVLNMKEWAAEDGDRDEESFHDKVAPLYHSLQDSIRKFNAEEVLATLPLSHCVDIVLKAPLQSNGTQLEVDDSLRSSDFVSIELPSALDPSKPRILKGKISRIRIAEYVNRMQEQSESEKRMMAEWEIRKDDQGNKTTKPFQPVPLPSTAGATLENIGKNLELNSMQSLDMVLKYTHPDTSSALPNALLLWTRASIFMEQHNANMQLCIVYLANRKNTGTSKGQLTLLQTFIVLSQSFRELIKIAYEELGDLIIYQGDFILSKLLQDYADLSKAATLDFAGVEDGDEI